jgi:2-oxoglutarate ferredoxin oxidoreductase subunit gamma
LIPANDIAVGLGNERAVNMVMLGGLIAVKPVITLEQCEAAIADAFGARKPQLVAINVEAVRVGYAAALAGK